MIKSVLIPIDLSENQKKIVPMIKELMKQYSPSMHLLFVVREDELSKDTYTGDPTMPKQITKIAPVLLGKMKEFVQQYLPDMVDFDMEVKLGDPADEIVSFAEEKGMNLIALCTYLDDKGDKPVIGSVTERVVRKSTVPVLTYNPPNS